MARFRLALPVALLLAPSLGCSAHWGGARKLDAFPAPAMARAPQRTLALDLRQVEMDSDGRVVDHYRWASPFVQASHASLTAWYADSPEEPALQAGARVIARSGRFLQASGAAADYRLSLAVVDEADHHVGLLVLSGMSLFTLPAYEGHDYRVVATLRDKAGRALGAHEVRQSRATAISWLLFPCLVFTGSPVDVEDRMWTRIFEDLVDFAGAQVERAEAPAEPMPARADALHNSRNPLHNPRARQRSPL